MDNKNKIFLVVGAVAVLATVGVVGAMFIGKDSGDTNMSTQTSISSDHTQTSYKDGDYTAAVSYNVPRGGMNKIETSLSIDNGKISTITTTNTTSDSVSQKYIDDFESAVVADATGKSIVDYKPSRIGGASMTTDAFAGSIAEITKQAEG